MNIILEGWDTVSFNAWTDGPKYVLTEPHSWLTVPDVLVRSVTVIRGNVTELANFIQRNQHATYFISHSDIRTVATIMQNVPNIELYDVRLLY